MRTRILSAWLVGALPLAVPAQTAPTTPAATTDTTKGAAQVGGRAIVDVVSLHAGNLGAPLRYGHVVPGSEQVQLGGRILAAGTDYGMDYETGVVYLKVPQRTGDSMVVSYRYDPTGQASPAAAGFAGVNSFGYNALPGLGLVGGLGLAERATDGSVISNNLYGWNNRLNYGGTSLGGLYLYSERTRNDVTGGLTTDLGAPHGDTGTETGASRFLLQNFRSNVLGGTVNFDVQDISRNFTSASQVRAAGYADSDVTRLMKERGLKRRGIGFTGLHFGDATVGANRRSVGDGHGGVDWQSYSLAQGGLKLSMNSQQVDKDFTRFTDISEADRDQLAKETGLSRQNFSGEFAQKTGKLSFNSTDVREDGSERHAVRREAKLDSGRLGLTFGQQEVNKSFDRMTSLTAAEQGLWGREIGTERQWAGLTAALGGKQQSKLAFDELDLKNDRNRFVARSYSYAGKAWTLDHFDADGHGSAVPTGSLQDAEGNAYVKRISGFFGAPATGDAQRAAFLAAGDVRRDLTKVSGNLGKGSTLNADRLEFGDGSNGGFAQSAALNGPKVTASYRRQDFGRKFTDATRLMDFEQARLGTLAGLDRTDIAFGVRVDKVRNFSFGHLEATDPTGRVDRSTLAYNDKGLQVTGAERNVSKGFASAAGMVDPENSLLAQFQGFQERDLGLTYTGHPGLKVQTFLQQATDETTNEARAVENTNVDWQMDKTTSVSYVSQRSSDRDPLSNLFSQSLQRLSMTHKFGTRVTLQLMDEQIQNDGKNNTAADSHKQYVSLETKLTPTTSLRTEQTRTDFSDGNKEDISANTVSTALTKKAGVSVTDVSIDRKGDDNDEKKTNYGFWYDLGKGLRLTYGYVQNSVGDNGIGTGNQMLTFGQTPNPLAPNQVGSVGASNVGGILVNGGYGENNFAATDPTQTHVQSFANIGLSTAKPITFAGLTDLRFNLGLDQAADYSQYLRQNQTFGLSGKLGKNAFALGYRSQLANPNQAPTTTTVGTPNISAIDRTVSLTTDPSPKAPLVVNGSVKFRTLPDDKDYMSRNFTVTARPLPGVELSNQVQTNLEQADPNVLLGSSLLADRGNKWTLGYKSNGDTSLSASWEQKENDTTNASSTLAAATLTLFQKAGSPLKITYGLDEVDGNVPRRQITRYSLQYDAKASSTQTFSLYLGNVDYAYDVADPLLRGDNWSMRVNYQIRF